MPPQHEMARLRADHAKIARLAEQLQTLLQNPQPPPEEVLTEARMALRRALVFHLKCEDWVLYPALVASDDAAIAAKARAFQAEMGALAAQYGEYIERWEYPATITANWAGYCADTGAMLHLLAARMQRENDELYPLAERAGQMEREAEGRPVA